MNMESDNIRFAELIKTAETEASYVFTNKDAVLLRMLQPLQGNRNIKQERVNQIAAAMVKGEFIPPIIVSLPYRIITEGNHRYQAALKCLETGAQFKLRVYLYKDTNALATARVINNTQKAWTASDRLKSYCFEGKESYLKLREFMEAHSDIFKKRNEYAITSALCLLAENRTRATMANTFYSGNLKITDANIKFAELMLSELSVIASVINDNACFARDASTGWIKARTRLGMTFDKFIKKLKKRQYIRPDSSAKAWFNMYISVAGGL